MGPDLRTEAKTRELASHSVNCQETHEPLPPRGPVVASTMQGSSWM